MNNQCRSAGVVVASLLLSCMAAPAVADEAELLQQIQQLTRRIEQLEAQQRAASPTDVPGTPAATPRRSVPIAPEAPASADTSTNQRIASTDNETVTRGTLPGSFKIPGTDTSIKFGGYARLDLTKDFNGGESGTIALPATIPFDGSAQDARRGQLSLTARQSRLYVRTLTPTSMGDATVLLEGDFYGAGGNETVTNSVAFRMRQAYAELGPWLVGQTWMNFNDILSLPETLDFNGGNGVVQEGRQAQIRYTARFTPNQQLSLSVENPESDVVGTVQTTISAATGPTSTTTLDKYPDLSARYVLSGDWGRVSASGLVRRITVNNDGSTAINGFVGESSVTGAAWAVQGRLKTFGADNVQFSLTEGPGVGRYILGVSNNTGAVIDDGRLKAIRQDGYLVGYQHFWSPSWRSNLIYGAIRSQYPHPAVPVTTPSRIGALFANVIWSPVPNGLIGLEWQRATVRDDAAPTPTQSNRGTNNRLELSGQYGF